MAVFGPGDLMDDFARKDADKASAPADGLVEALADYDTRLTECPVRNPARFSEVVVVASSTACRVCGAGRDGRCGLDNPWPVLEAARQAAAAITRLSADLEEARGLLNEAPVLVVNREAAKRTDDREALKYAREIHPWAVRARAFLTRTEKRHG